MSNLLGARAGLSAEMAIRFKQAFRLSVGTLMRMQAAHDLARVRADGGVGGVKRVAFRIMSSLRAKCAEMIVACENAFSVIERAVPAPQIVPFRDCPAYRFVEQTPQQMIVLKFARQVSGLHALDTLMLKRHIQEAGVIMRTLDEIAEDTQCIALAIIHNSWEPLHDRMMKFFWQEEYDDISQPAKSSARGMVDRKSIRAWTMRAGGIKNTSLADEAGRTIHRSMSGYVHAAASHIMDLYTENPPRFALNEMRDPIMLSGYVDLTVTYVYRGLVSSYAAVKAVAGHNAAQPFYDSIKEIEAEMADYLFPKERPKL